MSWVVEQSENTSAVEVSGDTITCRSTNGYGSPINVLFKDPADHNGQYFWQVDVTELGEPGGTSVGLTTDKGFKDGWGLKAMKYLGNLSDGGCLLVQAFGDQIKQGDKVGILLQLTDSEMKMYLFHNEQPLGLAFHFQSPYPKPLYPGKNCSCSTFVLIRDSFWITVVSFNSNGKVKLSRSQQIPTALNRSAPQYQGVEGDWKIVTYAQHPECAGVEMEIKQQEGSQDTYHLYARVINNLNCRVQHDSSSNEWTASHVMSTMMGGSSADMQKEAAVSKVISGIQRLDAQGQNQLLLQTNNGEQVRLERFGKAAPSAVTENIFN